VPDDESLVLLKTALLATLDVIEEDSPDWRDRWPSVSERFDALVEAVESRDRKGTGT
jgi:hypothetical protein